MSSENKIIIPVDVRFKEILPQFLERQKANIATLREAHRSSNFDSLIYIGHMMKGGCGGYGFFRLGELAGEVELAAQSKNRDLLNEKIALMEHHFSNVTIEFKKF